MTQSTAAEQKGNHGEKKELAFIRRELQRNLFLETALTAFGLGVVAAGGIVLAVAGWYTDRVEIFAIGLYVLVAHVTFHLAEFITAVVARPHDTHPGAFMVFHSKAYISASLLAFAEFLIETLFVPEDWKVSQRAHPFLGSVFRLNFTAVSFFSLVTLFFYGIRVVAMLQCGPSFSLMIEGERRHGHVLIQHGLYRYFRHPAYFGWFWRTVMAQLILANPFTAILHTAVTWMFFRSRIPYEELIMEEEDFFGEQYKAYKSKTIVGIPFC